VDYRRFLARTEESVAPVLGSDVWLTDRRLRLGTGDGGPGWWRVRVQGRGVELIAAATADERTAALAPLPRVRGHVVRVAAGFVLVHGACAAQPIALAPPDEDPPLLAPLRARRWPTGDLLLWDELEWEGEAEEQARRALEDGGGLQAVKGASAALRAAFAHATAQAAARALGIPAAPAELARSVRAIAEEGRPAAEAALRALAEERALWAARSPAPPQPPSEQPAAEPAPAPLDFELRAERALRAAGAWLLGARRIGQGLVEVSWSFQGARFVSVLQEQGLRVVDGGVCLAGADALVTLDSLPGVIRQAMEEDALVITRFERD
jgi:hypothetical protein